MDRDPRTWYRAPAGRSSRASRTSWPLELQLRAPAGRSLFVCQLARCLYIDIQTWARPITASCSYSAGQLLQLQLFDLVAVDLVAVDLVAVDLVAVDLVAVDLVAVDLVAVDLVAVDLVAVDLVPRSAVRGPWRVSECPPTPGPKKRAGSLAALALALFYTVNAT